jgi:hypothetical protein
MYLSPGSSLYIEWPDIQTNINPIEVLENINNAGEMAGIGLIDDLAYLLIQILELAYMGNVRDNSGFKQSGFFQALVSDLSNLFF